MIFNAQSTAKVISGREDKEEESQKDLGGRYRLKRPWKHQKPFTEVVHRYAATIPLSIDTKATTAKDKWSGGGEGGERKR